MSTCSKWTPPAAPASAISADHRLVSPIAPSAPRSGLYHRRGAHSQHRTAFNAAEDAGRAAGACEVHLRDDRNPQGAGDGALRCQRFDLRRIRPDHAGLARADLRSGRRLRAPDADALITRPPRDQRDALSLLDQAIAHGAAGTSAAEVRAMLGLADRDRIIDLFEAVMRGDAKGALTELAQQYAEGADPMAVLRDLAEITHWVSMRLAPEAADDPTVGPDERAAGAWLRARARHAAADPDVADAP